eukprot:1780766-Pyramimonas_sp.AAC.1
MHGSCTTSPVCHVSTVSDTHRIIRRSIQAVKTCTTHSFTWRGSLPVPWRAPSGRVHEPLDELT